MNAPKLTQNVVPLVVRGRVVTEDLQEFGARSDSGVFLAPDISRHLASLPLTDPTALSDLLALPVAEIIDYLVELGGRLDCRSNQHLALARRCRMRRRPRPSRSSTSNTV